MISWYRCDVSSWVTLALIGVEYYSWSTFPFPLSISTGKIKSSFPWNIILLLYSQRLILFRKFSIYQSVNIICFRSKVERMKHAFGKLKN